MASLPAAYAQDEMNRFERQVAVERWRIDVHKHRARIGIAAFAATTAAIVASTVYGASGGIYLGCIGFGMSLMYTGLHLKKVAYHTDCYGDAVVRAKDAGVSAC